MNVLTNATEAAECKPLALNAFKKDLISFHTKIIQNKSIKETRCVCVFNIFLSKPYSKDGGRINLILKLSSSWSQYGHASSAEKTKYFMKKGWERTAGYSWLQEHF